MGETDLKIMKFIIAILAASIIGQTFAKQGKPKASSLCMGNVEDTEQCSSCYNLATTTSTLVTAKTARQLESHACIKNVKNTIKDCRFYSGVLVGATKKCGDCHVCNSKAWLNIHSTSNVVTTVTCSDTAVDATANHCTAKVTDCVQNFCHKEGIANNAKYAPGCRQCKNDYKMNGTQTSYMGYASCASQTIKNCTVGSYLNVLHCAACKAGFAVVTAETSCLAFTADSGCRKLGITDKYCNQCTHSYYFDSTKCVLNANLITLGGMFMFVLAFFN